VGTKSVVIDTNVIISAFAWGGVPLEAVLAATKFRIIISDKQLEEIRRAVNYDRISLSPERRTRLFSILLEFGQIVKIQNKLDVIKEDPSDNVILETAVSTMQTA
jgi:putative PIN family toxin of toxin-antitoxin system